MSSVIKVENLSKQYRLGEIGTGSLSHDVNRWWHRVRGKENPYLKIGETNDRSTKGASEYVWSLKDINFEIEQGDAVGIIGRNGAGKSTLLKILSRVTGPTTGSVKVKGRIASLLEVGTGFHPELSGRDNIFLNGAILGMRKHEIQKKFDEIVDFSGVERYIDTPVKRYSSGMYVRLAFAVAAHLESEILIVDEVLAVGDADFQKKCLGKMSDVSKGEGRTVLFVSHNMGSLESLCNKGIVLNRGCIEYSGYTTKAIEMYSMDKHREVKLLQPENRDGAGAFRLTDFNVFSNTLSNSNSINIGDFINFRLGIFVDNKFSRKKIIAIIGVYSVFAEPILRLKSDTLAVESDEMIITCKVEESLNIKPGTYRVNIALFSEIGLEDHIADYYDFCINQIDYNLYNTSQEEMNLTKILLKSSWQIGR